MVREKPQENSNSIWIAQRIKEMRANQPLVLNEDATQSDLDRRLMELRTTVYKLNKIPELFEEGAGMSIDEAMEGTIPAFVENMIYHEEEDQ